MSCLFRTSKIVFPSLTINIEDMLRTIERYKCSSLAGLPKIVQNILDHPSRGNYNLTSLRIIRTGGMLVPVEFLNKIKKEKNITQCAITYGMTEINLTNTIFIDMINFLPENYKNSIGLPGPFIEFKVVNQNTCNIQPIKVEGELHVRGYCVTPGYYNDEGATRKSMDKSGWFEKTFKKNFI